MVQFTPFGQSSLFNNIVAGGGTPLGAVPMNFATATPYQWNTNPITPEPDTPEDGFDMGVFCSLPANAGHPMCSNRDKGSNSDKAKIKIEGTDRFTTDNNFIPTDEEIANMTNEEYIANLAQRGWIKNHPLGYLPSAGPMLTLKKGSIANPYFTLMFGKEQEARRKKIIEELVKRKYNVRGTDDNTTFNIMPNAQAGNLWEGNQALGTTSDQINYQQEQLREKNKDRILGGNPHADTYTYQQIKDDATQSGGTVNPHELNFTASPQNYTSAQTQAGAGLLNQGNPHMMYDKEKKEYKKQYAGDY